MAIREKSGNYYVYFRKNGKLKTRSLFTSDYKTAVERERLYMDLLKFQRQAEKSFTAFGGESPLPSPVACRRLRLSDMPTVAAAVRSVTHEKILLWENFVAASGCTYADEIDAQLCQSYLDDVCRGLSAKTFNNKLTALNSIFSACLVKARLAQSPFACVLRHRQSKIIHHRAITPDEFRRVYSVLAEPWKTAALISWHTALRLESVFRLSWADINAEDKSITLLPGKTARFGRSVYIPIHAELWDHLVKIPRSIDDNTPILSVFGKPQRNFPTFRSVRYFTGACLSVGVLDNEDGKVSFHSLRSSFITRMDAAGISRTATRGIAGHVSDDITDLYSHDKETAKLILNLKGVL